MFKYNLDKKVFMFELYKSEKQKLLNFSRKFIYLKICLKQFFDMKNFCGNKETDLQKQNN